MNDTPQRRKDPAGRHSQFWYDFARFNLTGWSIVIPTLAGLLLGAWLDDRWPVGVSWKLTLMIAGLVLGCVNAWYWIWRRENGRR